MEKAKLVVEGAGAVGVAALLGGETAPARDGTTVVVLSGGNVDAGLLASIARRHESEAGRRLVVLTRVPDRPGSLARLLALVGEAGANLVDVEHVREGLDLHVRETAVQLVLETRGREHADDVLGTGAPRRLRGEGGPLGRGELGFGGGLQAGHREAHVEGGAATAIAVEGERAAVALDDDRPGDARGPGRYRARRPWW